MNRALEEVEAPGAVYAVSSIVHLIVGAPCPPPLDGYLWNWDGAPGSDVPHAPPTAVTRLVQAMLNRGVHLMGGRAIVSAVHTDAEIDRTVAAFRGALDQMLEEGVITRGRETGAHAAALPPAGGA
ncbi:MAG: hypothetical protein U0531_14255 [Dehalococcoidia bacterium]